MIFRSEAICYMKEQLKNFEEVKLKMVKFIDFMGDRLPAKRKNIILNFAGHIDSFIDHSTGSKNLTMIHCDTHTGNFLFPKNPEGRVKLIDWDSWGAWFGARDLVQLIVMELTRDHRKEIGESLLKRYYHNILRQGIKYYSWDDLIYDFKWAIVNSLTLPVWFWSVNIWPGVWYTYLDRIFMAYDDLNCEELLS